MEINNDYVQRFDQLSRSDVASVGGKNASLGELISQCGQQGIAVPPGFATTARAYQDFIRENSLAPLISKTMAAVAEGRLSLAAGGDTVRKAILNGSWSTTLQQSLADAYRDLCRLVGRENCAVAVRSSATAEDLPEASFAGQLESYLNIRGQEALLTACKQCYASLFTDRAIAYRNAKQFDHLNIALSVGVQIMVRSDLACAGVMFSIDTETGFDNVVVINAAWGLGENVVQGNVDPDEYQVFKPLLGVSNYIPIIGKTLGSKQLRMIYSDSTKAPTCNVETTARERGVFTLSDQETLLLAQWAIWIEAHYGCPMDIEWAKDGENGQLYVVQARPETVQSQRRADIFKSYRITGKKEKLLSGLAIGQAVVAAPVCIIADASKLDEFVDGAILVTENTSPDWVPVMKKASAIVTNHGGRTSHAAIVSRELGVPAIIGTGNATQVLTGGQQVTVSCAEGDQGFIYAGTVEFSEEEIDLSKTAPTSTRVMLNLANPAAAFRWWRIPADGVGLARMEFVISNHIRIHPLALVHFAEIDNADTRMQIETLTQGYSDKPDYFVDTLAIGLARIAAVFYPKPAIIRMSDFKTNEYANLIGGAQFEPEEENPMLGFRGASRYYSPRYSEGFALECKAIHKLRTQLGFTNVIVMIPFCRTVTEADQVIDVMAQHGLVSGNNKLEIYMMCEIPANVVLASEFAKRFDGFSIGSNDLTQLTLGVDRDSTGLASLFDERDAAVKWMIEHSIVEAHRAGIKIGLCGQAPSDHPEFAGFLVNCGIDSISVSPDSFVRVKSHVANAEKNASLMRAVRKKEGRLQTATGAVPDSG